MSFFILLAIALATVLPAIIWLVFFAREDVHPEPKRIIAFTFGIGVLSALPTLLVQIIFKDTIGENAGIIFIFLGLATIEEVFKFLAAWYAVSGSRYFDEPIDAMIYMIAAASGFATIENILIALGSIESLTLPALYETGNVLLLRFIGATLLHILASGIVGYYWAKSIAARHDHRGLLVYGIIMATLVHTVFNYLIAVFGDQNVTYGSLILIVAAFFVLNDFEILKRKPKFSPTPTKTA